MIYSHFAHLPTKSFYNGVKADVIAGNVTTKNGIHNWADKGIAGRGVLLDFASWAESQGKTYDVFSPHPITYSDLRAVGYYQGLDIRPKSQGGDVLPGDILLIRSGFHFFDAALTQADREKMHTRPFALGPDDGQQYIGLEQSPEIVDWLHDSYFAAVAGDMPSFECWPSRAWERGIGGSGKAEEVKFLHEFLLALWGCPLGELWDLERLGRRCKLEGRWTFFVSSAPAHLIGGVASTPNALAIF